MSAQTGFQSQFKRGDAASPEVFTALANVVSITPPQRSRETVALEEIANDFEEYIPGVLDAGEVSLTLNFNLRTGGNYSEFASLQADQKAETTHNYQILIKDPTDGSTLKTIQFAAIITALNPTEVGRGTKLMVEATFKISGEPTWS